MLEATDTLDLPLSPGDYIAWAVGGSSCPTVRVGKILKISWKRKRGYGVKDDCAQVDADCYSLQAEPLYGVGTNGRSPFPKKEVPDYDFMVPLHWDTQTGARLDPPQETFPGVKMVYDPNGKHPKSTIQKVENVVKVDEQRVLWLSAQAVEKNFTRKKGHA